MSFILRCPLSLVWFFITAVNVWFHIYIYVYIIFFQCLWISEDLVTIFHHGRNHNSISCCVFMKLLWSCDFFASDVIPLLLYKDKLSRYWNRICLISLFYWSNLFPKIHCNSSLDFSRKWVEWILSIFLCQLLIQKAQMK